MSQKKNVKAIAAFSSLVALGISTAFAATTPYDLIRPTWPLTWDAKAFDAFDVTVTKKTGMLPQNKTPENFKAGELMPDTLDQAYLDAINTKISPIRVNQAGYLKSDKERQFYFVGSKATEFEVVDAYGKSLSTKVTGTFTASDVSTSSNWTIIAGTNTYTTDQKRYQVEFTGPSGKIFVGKIPQSVPTDKRLRIKVGDEFSSTFIVSDDVYTMAKDATLKFFGIQRSGNSESWFHGPSHMKDGGGSAVTNDDDVRGPFDASLAGTLAGGWYDCGDFLKESHTQAFAFMALSVMSATNPSKDVDHYAYNQGDFVNTDGVPDVLREAKHGADFFLKAYDYAKGVVDDMPVSVGNFGSDHAFWSRPEVQDYLPVDNSPEAIDRGGPASRTVRLGELGANISAEIAAGLAILSKEYKAYDATLAENCLKVAEKMYDFAKSLAQGKTSYDEGKPFKNNKHTTFSTYAYNGNNEFHDDLALASVALLYATGKKEYADDMIRTKNLYPSQTVKDGAGFFAGGWFAGSDGGMLKNVKNTGWANSHSYALYALYKLILTDKAKATNEYGLTEEERVNAIEDCLADMIANLGDLGNSDGGSTTLTLPATGIGWKANTVYYNSTWYIMQADQTWNYNRYQLGNTFEVLAYADVAADIEKQGIKLPNMASTGFNASEMRQLGINQLNYMLGMNPWDISFVYGIGDKNDAHPHHRTSNPEGRNASSFDYKYNCPVGGLLGGVPPGSTNSWTPQLMSWEDYHISETCLDGSTVLLSALTLLSNGGNEYFEKKCDNCKTDSSKAYTGEGIYASTYHYTWDKLDAYSIRVVNSSMNKLDSGVAYIYFDATEDEIKSGDIAFELSLCTVYNIVRFNQSCDNYAKLGKDLRSGKPVKVEDTYNKDKKTYTWEQAISLPTLDIGTTARIDVYAITRIAEDDTSTTFAPAKVKLNEAWSFTSHTAKDGAPAYEGAPNWEKDQGNLQEAPKDAYIVVRGKGKLLWGYGPAKTTSDRVGIVKIANGGNARMQLNGKSLFVTASAKGTKTVKIFDLLGNQLMEQSFDGTQTEVKLSKLPHRGSLVAKLLSNNRPLAIQSFKLK